MVPQQGYVSVSRRPPDIEDYIDILRRYRSWIVGPTFAGLVIAVVVAFLWLERRDDNRLCGACPGPSRGTNNIGCGKCGLRGYAARKVIMRLSTIDPEQRPRFAAMVALVLAATALCACGSTTNNGWDGGANVMGSSAGNGGGTSGGGLGTGVI